MDLDESVVVESQADRIEELVRPIKKYVPLVVRLQLFYSYLRRRDAEVVPGSRTVADIHDCTRVVIEASGRRQHFLPGSADGKSVGRAGDNRLIKIGGPEITRVSGDCQEGGEHGNDQDSFPRSHGDMSPYPDIAL